MRHAIGPAHRAWAGWLAQGVHAARLALLAGLCLAGLLQTLPLAQAQGVAPTAIGAAGAAGSAQARFEQALRASQEGRDREARALLEALVQEFPQRPEARVNLAVLLARQGLTVQARQQLDAALRSDPVHAHAYDQLLALHAHMARDAYARAALATADTGASGVALLPLTRWSAHADAAGSSPTATSASAAATVGASTLTPAAQAASAGAAAVESNGGAGRILWVALIALLLLGLGLGSAWAARKRARPAEDGPPTQPSTVLISPDAAPEERLIEVYRLIGEERLADALAAAETLAHDQPHFQLGQLVYADLLLASGGQLAGFAQPAADAAVARPGNAAALHQEAMQRLQALRERPPKGAIPRQLLLLPPSVRHVVAVDATRSRLHLFENRDGQLQRQTSLYVALGSQGVGKREEGDQRTPLGVYHITSRLDGRQLGDFYGPGALPLNYPNEHDRRLGRTGANIWLHGTPSAQYTRSPRSTNGCVVLANGDMARLLRELQPRHTPVVIAQQLEWVQPAALQAEREKARALVETWRLARTLADMRQLGVLYARHFDNGETGVDGWRTRLANELHRSGAREREITDLTALAWHEKGENLIVDFTEVTPGAGLAPQRRRQYWARESGQWKIFSEGVFE
jgi:tetratricopeptide (TPR) repeat protein